MSRLYLVTAILACSSAAIIANTRSAPLLNSFTLQSPATPVASEALDGTWELVSVIEDGKMLPLEMVKQTMIKDARVVVKGQLAAVIRPDGKVRTLAFVTNPTATPKTVDIAGEMKMGGKGIYMRDGDVLMICTRGSDSEARPTVMASLPGTDTFLLTFRRVNGAPAAPAVLMPPTAPALPANDQVQSMIIGTWGHQTDDRIVKGTLNPDGTYSIRTTYKKGFKKLFDAEDRTSGTWKYKDGDVIMTATASTVGGTVGQVSSYHITSINKSEVVYVDNQSGQRRIEWKLR